MDFGLLDREQLASRSTTSLLILPVGATEQHGPGLPTATDTLHVAEIARRAATQAAEEIPVVLAPALPFGSSAHHLPFGATLSLETETLMRVLMDLGRSAVRSGFTRLFFLNGHGGNHEIVQLAARDLAISEGCDAAGGSWWAMAQEALRSGPLPPSTPLPGHAGHFESSLLRAMGIEPRESEAYDSERLRTSKPGLPYRAEFGHLWEAQDGYTDDPRNATAEEGQLLLALAADAVAQHLVSFYHSCDRLHPR